MTRTTLRVPFVLLVLLAPFAAACGGGYALTQPDQTYYLQTNLRATSRGVVSSVLGWRGTDVVPVCTPVRVTEIESRRILFEDAETGERFQYVLHRSTRLGVEEHFARYFGTSCAPEVDAADLRGIEEGLVEVGMTRAGVLVALGYPPEHRTPSLTDATWTYWGDPGRVLVSFGGDRVVAITDERGHPIDGAIGGEVTYVATTEVPTTTSSGELQVVDGASLAVDADGTVIVPSATTPAPSGTVAVEVQASTEASVEVAPEPTRDGRRRRRRRLRTAGIIVGAAAVTTGVAVAAHRANRADRSEGTSAAPSSAPSVASPASTTTTAPTTTVVRETPRGGRLHDRCGAGSGCGDGLICDASSNQCRLIPGTMGEAPPCRDDRECPTGTVCGVSRLTPARGALCWSPDVVGR
jgi:hypothetical protein